MEKKKKKKVDLTEMKKAPWDFGIRPPDTTVADIISGTWLDDEDDLVFINANVPGERAGFVKRDGDLELSYIGYRSPNEFVFQGPKEEGYYYAIATVIGDTILWDNGTTSVREQRRYRDLEKPVKKWLCDEWISIEDNASEDEASTTVYFVNAIGTELEAGFYDRHDKTPFLRFVGLTPITDEWVFQYQDGRLIEATINADGTVDWSDGTKYVRSPVRDDPETDFTSLLFEGKWATWDEDGVPEGMCVCAGFKHFLHVQWNDGSPLVKFRFTGREGDRLWFDCEGAISAVFNGDQITWDDGCIWKPETSVDIMKEYDGCIWKPETSVDIMKEFTTPRKFFQGGPLLPGVSTLVDNMLAISPTDPYDHSHQIIHDAYQSVLQKDKEGPMKMNSDGDRDDALKWGDGSVHRRVHDIDPDPELKKTGGRASGDNAIDFGHLENIACEPILGGSGTGNAATLPHDWGDDLTGAKEFTTPRNQSVVQRDKENPMNTNSGGDTNISSDIQWEFLIKSYTDPGYGISTAETTATCFGHYDKDQDVDSGATYCFYLHGYFDLAKEWESKLQGYNDVVKEWESKLQGYNEVSYQLHRPWKRPRFG